MENEKICKDCLYYIPHYAKLSNLILETNCGHCTFPRLKTRKPKAKACEHYIEIKER